jgi:aminoglycoside/choline kinase family phosphotransferase
VEEAKLFTEWYIDKKLKKSEQKKFKNSFYKIVNNLAKKINQKNDTFVHRDFHISNLMMLKNDIGIIDSQDALIGNKAYDLASLIDDVRFQTSVELKKKIYNFYLKTQKKLNKKSFKNDFEIISVLRNLKIIGIFTRLAVRDNKKKYLKLIPYAWKLIKLRSQNDIFKDLNNLLKVLKKNK